MKIIGNRVVIRPLELKDVFYMKNWGNHDNPLLSDYNFPYTDEEDIKKWFKHKTNSFFNRYYGVLNEQNRLIGYLGIKDIKFIRRKSTLGIVFDPNYVDKGYGTETLNVFLEYYFEKMKMKTMLLEVAEFNQRAYNVYVNLGFKHEGYYLEELVNEGLDLNSRYVFESKPYLVMDNKKIYHYIYWMKLSKKDFIKK